MTALRQPPRGSAILLALLLLAVAAVLTAGWLTLVTARSGYVEQMSAGVQRRIARENARALAEQFLLERVIPSTDGAAFDYDLPDPAWGGIRVPAWTTAPLLSVAKAAGVNAFNPGNGDGYTLDLAVTLVDGDTNADRRFQIKSRSPLLSGNPLANQTPTLTPSASVGVGAFAVAGGALVWVPGVGMTFAPTRYFLPEGLTAVAVAGALPNNSALPRLIANPRSGGAPFYGGQFDAVDNASLAANSLVAKTTGGTLVNGSAPLTAPGVTCDGNGSVTITPNTPGLANVLIPGEISSLTLVGQAAANNAAADALPAMLIVVNQALASTRDLTGVTLSGHNNRRVILAIKKAGGSTSLPVTFGTANASWRLLLEVENVPVAVTANGANVIRGGLRSDRSISLAGGTVSLQVETDPKLLERLASRQAWVESFVP